MTMILSRFPGGSVKNGGVEMTLASLLYRAIKGSESQHEIAEIIDFSNTWKNLLDENLEDINLTEVVRDE